MAASSKSVKGKNMKEQFSSTEQGEKNLDVASILTQGKQAIEEVEQHAGDEVAKVIEKIEAGFSSVVERIEQTTDDLFSEINSNKSLYIGLAVGAVAVGGVFLAYRAYAGKKALSLEAFSMANLLPKSSTAHKSKKVSRVQRSKN